MPTIKQVRDDVVAKMALLSAFTTRSITPRGVWVPDRNRTDALPDVMVAPAERVVELVGRGVRSDQFILQVGICDALADDRDAAAAAGHVLADAVIDGLLGVRVGGVSNVLCYAAKQLVINAPDQWRTKDMFVSVVELTLRG